MIIVNSAILSMNEENEIFKDKAVFIEDGIIREIGPENDIIDKYPEDKILDAGGRILMPGFINTHTHLYSTFARGIPMKDAPPENFPQILERLWWRLDKALGPKAIYCSAEIPLIQAIRCGTTTLFDHHASPGTITDSLEMIADAFEEAGIRACLCYEVSDRDGEIVSSEGIRENLRLLERCKKYPDSRLKALFGLHASFTIGEKTLEKCVEAASDFDAGFHVHCAEDISDQEHALTNYGKTVVKRFRDAGILNPKTILAHGVHITENDMDIIAETKTNLVHNPRSNMNNAVGCAKVLKMLEKGILVGLGTDGMSSCMVDELKVANLIHKHENKDPRVAWVESVNMLFKNNSKIAGKIFGEKIGVIEEGAVADIIIVDYDPPTPMNQENLVGHILFGIADAQVDTTIVAGKILMKGKEILVIDEKRVCKKSREVAKEVWKNF
jgi:putative selenium metabolism protein SsnA